MVDGQKKSFGFACSKKQDHLPIAERLSHCESIEIQVKAGLRQTAFRGTYVYRGGRVRSSALYAVTSEFLTFGEMESGCRGPGSATVKYW